MWERFWDWYENKILEALIPSAVILYLQIPHTLTAADCFFDGNFGLYGFSSITDVLLYGIDLLEIIPIIAITMQIFAQIRKRTNNNH